MLYELFPTAKTFALLFNPSNVAVTERLTTDVEAGARGLGVEVHVLHASTVGDLNEVFAKLAGTPVVIGADAFFVSQSETLARLALKYEVPAIFENRRFAAAGGLVSYGTSTEYLYGQVGIYAGRILKGEKPADLPVLQPTKLDLIVTLKAAKTLGITVPQALLATADEVIE